MNLPPGLVPIMRQPMMVPIAMPMSGVPSSVTGHPGMQAVPVSAGAAQQYQHAALMAHAQQMQAQQMQAQQMQAHQMQAQQMQAQQMHAQQLQAQQIQPGLIGTMPHGHPTLIPPSYAAALQASQLSQAQQISIAQAAQAGLLGQLQQSPHGLVSPYQQAISPLQAVSPYASALPQSSYLIGTPMQARLQSQLMAPQMVTAEQLQALQEQAMLDPSAYGVVDNTQIATPKSKSEIEAEQKPFVLCDYNSDLNLLIGEEGYGGHSITSPEGFCFCWAGARATQGVTRGKVYYEVHITEHLPVQFPSDHQEQDPHVVRVGWSIDVASLQLGEEEYSYGYGGTGKFAVKSKFQDYGNRYCAGDVIGALLDLESKPPNISFMKNGKWMTVAHNLRGFPVGQPEMALFPHILSKNCRFKVNFGQMPAWFAPPPGFVFVQQTPAAHRIVGKQPPKLISDCEIIMIVGLPGAGKTTWANKTRQDNMDKRYNIIGTDTLIDRMRVNGLARKRNYAGRWDVLIDKATKCLNKLFVLGSKRLRNYILDQTNVYPTAQARKMKHFRGFKRRACVLITDDRELVRRSNKRTEEDGKVVPISAVLEMKANFKLPEKDGVVFDEVTYLELQKDAAEILVQQYNQEGKYRGQSQAQYGQQQQMRPAYSGYGGYTARQPAINWHQNVPPPSMYPSTSSGLDSIKKEYTSSQDDWQRPAAAAYQSYAGYRLPNPQYPPPVIKQEPANVVSTWSASQDWQSKPQTTSRMYPATTQSWNWSENRASYVQTSPSQATPRTQIQMTHETTTMNQSYASGVKNTRSPSPGDDPTRKRIRRTKWDTPDEADSTDLSAIDNRVGDRGDTQASDKIPGDTNIETPDVTNVKVEQPGDSWQQNRAGDSFQNDENLDNKDWFVKDEPDSNTEQNVDVIDKSNSIRQADSTTDPGNYPPYMRGRGFFRGRPPFRGPYGPHGPHDMRFRPFGPPRFPPFDRFGHPRRFMPPRFGPPPMGRGPPGYPPRMGRFPPRMGHRPPMM